MKENSRGITLIALVITIIVLLILAGISIASLTGENGILTKASNAKEKSIVEEEKEQIKLAYNATLANKLEKNDSSNITDTELQAELNHQNTEATANGTNPIKVTYNKTQHMYEIDHKGNIKILTNSDVNEGKYSFTIDGITCYFDENDLGFGLSYDYEDGRMACNMTDWFEKHIYGAEYVYLGQGFGDLYIDGNLVSPDIYNTYQISEGEALSLGIEDLKSKIHYDEITN